MSPLKADCLGTEPNCKSSYKAIYKTDIINAKGIGFKDYNLTDHTWLWM